MSLSLSSTVDQWIKANPDHAKVFLRHGIECCHCGAGLTLAEACQKQGLDSAVVLAELLAMGDQQPAEKDLASLSPAEVAGYVRETYHADFVQMLSQLLPFTQKISRKHGANNPVLAGLEWAFEAVRQKLTTQIEQVEADVLPRLAADRQVAKTPLKQVAGEVAQRQERIATAMAQVRQATSGYAVGPESCNTYRAVMRSLAELEASIQQYGQLLNSQLLPAILAAGRQQPAGV